MRISTLLSELTAYVPVDDEAVALMSLGLLLRARRGVAAGEEHLVL
jgi:hypothetical protein